MAKVFCRQCRYYKRPEIAAEAESVALASTCPRCLHPELAAKVDRPVCVVTKAADCCKLNKDNDCKHFISLAPRAKGVG